MRKKIFVILTLVIFFIAPTPTAANEFMISGEEEINIAVYQKLTPAIVSIEAQMREGMSTGTGCIIHRSGVILTSMHVVKGASVIDVTTKSGKSYRAQILALLKNDSDLALIKIDAKENLDIVALGDSESVKVGQRVLTIGNPFGFYGTLTTGIISRIDYARNKIQTDAAINPGCSGGPLINVKGEVIGINQSIYNPDNNRSNIGIGFAIPINNAKEFIEIALQRNIISNN